MNVFVELKGCDATTEISLTCTEEQFLFLRELSNATKHVSTYSCMPVVSLFKEGDLSEEIAPIKSEHLRFIEGEDENGNGFSYYELDTTKL